MVWETLILPFAVGALTEADLDHLVLSKVGESRGLEFKLQLPGKSDADRKEFLADVTSFANAEGGVILYGIATERDERGKDTGVALSVEGLPDLIADQEIQRLESMLRDAVDPPLTAQVRFQAISSGDTRDPVLAIGVFPSFAGPHQVTFAGSTRFWVRGQAGKYQPQVSELRNLFIRASTWLKQADEFRTARLAQIRASQSLHTSSIALIHLLPLTPPEGVLDLAAHQNALSGVRPLRSSGWSWRYNAEGFMTYVGNYDSSETSSYTQWFRTGGVEGFSSHFVGPSSLKGTPVIWLSELRSAVTEWLANTRQILEGPLAARPPYAIVLTLSGIAGAQVPTIGVLLTSHAVDRDDLLLPPILFDPARDALPALLSPLMDTIAQAAGAARAPE